MNETLPESQTATLSDATILDTTPAQIEQDNDALLKRAITGWTVGKGLASAEAAGTLLARPDGRWQLPSDGDEASEWIRKPGTVRRNCKFYMHVMFLHVYQQSRVPQGCASCFKVKVAPRTVRELVALSDVAQTLPYTSKCGLDAKTTYTSGLYGGYFYLDGIADARAAYANIREAVDKHSKLGTEVPVFIKRGCSIYEIKCGPSDQYRFASELGEIETALLARIDLPPRRSKPPMQQRMLTFAQWMETAYMSGDDSYLDFTAGKRWYPATVRYDPNGNEVPVGGGPSACSSAAD